MLDKSSALISLQCVAIIDCGLCHDEARLESRQLTSAGYAVRFHVVYEIDSYSRTQSSRAPNEISIFHKRAGDGYSLHQGDHASLTRSEDY